MLKHIQNRFLKAFIIFELIGMGLVAGLIALLLLVNVYYYKTFDYTTQFSYYENIDWVLQENSDDLKVSITVRDKVSTGTIEYNNKTHIIQAEAQGRLGSFSIGPRAEKYISLKEYWYTNEYDKDFYNHILKFEILSLVKDGNIVTIELELNYDFIDLEKVNDPVRTYTLIGNITK